MKKGIALIIAVILSFTSAGVIAAEGTASADTAEPIDVEISEFNFTVTYSKDTEFEKATLQMFNNDYTEMLYMAETTPVQSDGKYVAAFEQFSVDSSLPTGKYIIRVSDGKSIEEPKVVDFFNYEQQINAFNDIKSAQSDDELASALEGGKELLDFGYSKYSSFSVEWQKKIRASVLAIVWDTNKTDDENMQLFFDYMNKMYEAVGILTETDAAQVITKIDTAEILTFDKRYYTQNLVADKSYIGDIVNKHDYARYTDVEAAITALYKQFDGAVLTYIIANCDWSTAEEALRYYKEVGLINVDFASIYDNFNSNKKSNVFTNLKSEKITDYTSLAGRFAYYVQQEKRPAQGGSDNSGGGGIGTVITKPVITKPVSPSTTEETKPFNDLSTVSWAEDAVLKLTEKGAVSGDGSGNFKPSDSITREEFTKIIVAAFDMYDENAVDNFEDVSESDWSAKYIASAYQNGIISGIGDGIFGKKNEITREDAATILYRIYRKTNDAVNGEDEFADREAISGYAKESISAMYQLGVLRGYEDGKFYPKKNITRAEGAVMIYNLLKLYQ